MKILVPVDFSDCSVNALRYAAAFGIEMQAELILFHAFHIPIGGDATFFVDMKMVKKREQSLQERLLQLGATLPGKKQLSYQCFTTMALATEGIFKAIREHEIDLVIMGTKGATHLSDEWLGSTTYSVVRKASCPVIAVPEAVKGLHLQAIALASDLRPFSNPAAFGFLKDLARRFGASIHMLHVHPHPAEISADQGEEALILDEIFYNTEHTYHFLEGTDVEEEFQRYIQTHAIDMLVIVPRKHNLLERLFLRRMTKKMALHTKIPLLSIYA